jgi:hypothetical protein
LFTTMQIARRQPTQTEELLATIDLAALLREERAAHPRRMPLYCTSCDQMAVICMQMAPVDPSRAGRIAMRLFDSLGSVAVPAERDDPSGSGKADIAPDDFVSDVEVALLKATTFARMAERVVATDRGHARQWLEQAVKSLQGLRIAKSRDGWFLAPAAAMATLLPLAEQIDPALAHELFWRSLSLRISGTPGDGILQRGQEGNSANLAKLLGRYDMEVARRVLAPLVQNNRGEFLEWSPADNAQVVFDCDAVLARAREFVHAPFDESPSNRERLRLDVAARLASVQNYIERDWPGYFLFETELNRERLGFSFHHPWMDE